MSSTNNRKRFIHGGNFLTNSSAESGSEQRTCAEEKLPAFKGLSQELLSAEETQLLLHELQEQKVELEMQNEELRCTQHELEMSRSRYFDLYSLAPVGYLTLDDKGVILDANLAAAGMLGVMQPDLLRKQITQFIFDEDRDAFYLQGRQACEIRMVRADGSIFWVSLQAAPERKGECGITLSDITERKLLEDALKESEATFRAHVENSFDVIFTLDAEGNFIFVSPAWERHFGYPASVVMGKSFAPTVHPDDVQPCVEYLTRILSSGKSGTSPVYRVKCADGSLRSFVANGMPYTDTKGRILFIGVGHDVSEQLQAEQDRLDFERQLLHSQKLKSLGVLAGGIAHDFNNLLQAVLGNMELASMNLPPDSAPLKHIEHAIQAAKHAAGLTSQMLAYSGKGSFVIKKLDLNDLVNKNVTMLRTAVSRTISMDLHTEAHLPAVMADEAQLQQVVMNLITNAAEAIEEQPGFIKLSTGIKEYDRAGLADSRLIDKPEPGRFVYLEVTDNGVGMNEDTQARIFDPFFTTKFIGRGLGMSAVLGIVKGHGGALFVESAPGRGSTITVVFPALESETIVAEQDPETPISEKVASTEAPLLGTALVVDDEKNVLRIAVAMVKLCGFSVISACDGVDAIGKFREQAEKFDVVLMDLTMPNMDGVAAMHNLRLIKPDVKVILTSGFNEQEFDERISGQPPSGFIRKPYSLKEVKAELLRVFQGCLS
ncbi:MAG TPA: PAS domain S-box protein [Dongiaceae bacterium]|nr:PAS domain S-box protein [Dongiaceae bacterium]